MSDDEKSIGPRLLCKTWDGKQGDEFELLRFKPDFIGGLHTVRDKYSTLYEHLNRTDYGSGPRYPHPGVAPTRLAPGDKEYRDSERARLQPTLVQPFWSYPSPCD